MSDQPRSMDRQPKRRKQAMSDQPRSESWEGGEQVPDKVGRIVEYKTVWAVRVNEYLLELIPHL